MWIKRNIYREEHENLSGTIFCNRRKCWILSIFKINKILSDRFFLIKILHLHFGVFWQIPKLGQVVWLVFQKSSEENGVFQVLCDLHWEKHCACVCQRKPNRYECIATTQQGDHLMFWVIIWLCLLHRLHLNPVEGSDIVVNVITFQYSGFLHDTFIFSFLLMEFFFVSSCDLSSCVMLMRLQACTS